MKMERGKKYRVVFEGVALDSIYLYVPNSGPINTNEATVIENIKVSGKHADIVNNNRGKENE